MNLLQLMYLTKQATFEQETMEKEARLGMAKALGGAIKKAPVPNAAKPAANASTFGGRVQGFAKDEWNRLTPAQRSAATKAGIGTGAGLTFGAGYQAGKDGNLQRAMEGMKKVPALGAAGAASRQLFGK